MQEKRYLNSQKGEIKQIGENSWTTLANIQEGSWAPGEIWLSYYTLRYGLEHSS